MLVYWRVNPSLIFSLVTNTFSRKNPCKFWHLQIEIQDPYYNSSRSFSPLPSYYKALIDLETLHIWFAIHVYTFPTMLPLECKNRFLHGPCCKWIAMSGPGSIIWPTKIEKIWVQGRTWHPTRWAPSLFINGVTVGGAEEKWPKING